MAKWVIFKRFSATNGKKTYFLEFDLDPHFEGWFNGTTLHVWMVQKKLHSIYGHLNNNLDLSINQDQKVSENDANIALEISRELVRHVWLDMEIKLAQGIPCRTFFINVLTAGVKVKISTIMADLVSSFQGQGLAYDEGIFLLCLFTQSINRILLR